MGRSIFLFSPMTGPVMALGALAAIAFSAVEGAVAFGASGAIGAAIYSMGIPEHSVLEYERVLKADSFLVFVHGTAGDVACAKSILATVKPTHLDVHEGVTEPKPPGACRSRGGVTNSRQRLPEQERRWSRPPGATLLRPSIIFRDSTAPRKGRTSQFSPAN